MTFGTESSSDFDCALSPGPVQRRMKALTDAGAAAADGLALTVSL